MEDVLRFLGEFAKTRKQLITSEKWNELKRICREEEYYDAKLPRILVIGRFKSGKSMLINALIGKKVAAVDALEKTSWIARYWPGKDEFCYLQKKDGSVQEISVNEFIENTENDSYSAKFLEEISRIDVGYQGDKCTYALIDSPGFGSINVENEKRAMDSLKDADLVIYAVDVNKLGNLREQSVISEIKKSGVPMICVGTQYDGDIAQRKTREEVRKMIADYTEFSQSEIYPVSAKIYIKTGMDEGMDELREFCKKVSVQNQMYRENAASARRYRTNHMLILQLQELQNELLRVKGAKVCFEQEYDYTRSRIRSEMTVFIRQYVLSTLYAEYKPQLVRMVQLIKQQNLGEKGLELLQTMIPEGYMDRYWNNLREVVLQKLHELWQEKYALPNTELAELQTLFQESTMLRNMDIGQMSNFLQLGYNKELSENGMKLSFGVAGLASVYEAVLGVNAAQIALAGAIVSTGLPIMLIGCGLTTYWLKKKQLEENEKNVDVYNAIEKNIENFAECVIDACMKKVEQIDQYLKTTYVAYYDKELQSYLPDAHTMVELLDQCQNHIHKLANELETLVYYDAEGNAAVNRIYELSGKIEGLNQELNAVCTENATHRRELDKAVEECRKIQSEKQQIEEKYNDEQEIAKQLKSNLQKTKNEIRYYQNLAANNERAATEAREEVEKTSAHLKESQKREESLKVRLEKAKTEGKHDRDEIRELEAELSSVSGEKNKLQEKLVKANEKKKQYEAEIKKAVDKEQKAQSMLKQTESELEIKNGELQETKKQLNNAHEEVTRKTEEMEALKKELKERSDHVIKLEKELEKLQVEWDTNTYQPQDEYLGRWEKISTDLDGILHDGRNKYVLNEEMGSGLMQFENLVFLEDEAYAHFLEDIAELLRLGQGFASEHKKNIVTLVDERYIYTRNREYRIYYGVQIDTKEIEISYIETFIQDSEQNRKLRNSLKNQFILEDDQIRYKIFDAVLSAKKEILVAVPWITKKAWENKNDYPMSMENAFEKALQKEPNLRLIITTGISAGESESKDKQQETDWMVEYLKNKFISYKNRVFIYNNREIHIKYLVVDDNCVMQGSLNYLSNQGIYKEKRDDSGSAGRAGENMSVSEYTENVERGRAAVYRRAGQVYRRLEKM